MLGGASHGWPQPTSINKTPEGFMCADPMGHGGLVRALSSRCFPFTLSPTLFPPFVLPTHCVTNLRINRLNFTMDSSLKDDFTNTTAELVESGPQPPDTLVQYVVLRRDLIDSWPLGSVVTQGCHASVAAIWAHKDDPHAQQYCSHLDSMHKVTLEVKGETQMLNLSEKLKENSIDHKLWIEQPENIPTCLATKPYPKSIVSSHFKRLKLCK